MALSEARKRANKKWNNENLTSFTVKLNKEKTELFRAAAAKNGTNPTAVLRKAIEDYIKESQGE